MATTILSMRPRRQDRSSGRRGIAALTLVIALAACQSGPQEKTTGLDRAAVEATPTSDTLLQAVAAGGITTSAAPHAAARAAADAPAVAEAEDLGDLQAFLTKVLDAEADTLTTLVAVGIDALGQKMWERGLSLRNLVPQESVDEADWSFALRGGTYGIGRYYRVLGLAAAEAGIDPDARWGALRAVLDLAAATPPQRGSLIWLSCRLSGSCDAPSGEIGPVATEGQQGQGDERFGRLETVGHAGENPDLGVRGLDKTLG